MSVEQFRQWVQARLVDNAKHLGTPLSKQVRRRWNVKAETLVFYFELAGLSNNGSEIPLGDASS